MPVFLLLVASASMPSPDRMTLNSAAQAHWPLLDPAMEQVLVQHRAELDPAARRSWAIDRALPMLSGEIDVSDAVLKDVLSEVSRTLNIDPKRSDLLKMEQARRDYSARELGRAATRYAAIEKESSLWPEALRERAWTLLLLGRPDDALGATVSLLAPYFAPEDHAEGRLMKATVFLERCRYDEARTEIAALADALPERFTDDDARLALASGTAPGSPAARLAWSSPLVVRARVALTQTAGQPVHERVHATGVRLLKAAFVAESEVARDARERALKIRYESFRQQRGLLETNREATSPKPAALPSLEDDEVEWTFDGTFWRDELGTYRYTAADACPREAKP